MADRIFVSGCRWMMGMVLALFWALPAYAEGDAKPVGVVAKPAAIASTHPSRVVAEPTVVGIAPAFFWETTRRKDEQRVGGQTFDDQPSVEFESVGSFTLQAWFLTPILIPNLRFGGGVAWYNNYTLREVPEEGEEVDEEDDVSYGHMFQIALQPEYVIPHVLSKLNVIVGVRGGLSILVSSGDFGDELDALEKKGFDVSALPALGGFVGPHVGASWQLAERIYVRADFGVQFSKLWLFNATAEAQGFTSSNKAKLTTTRPQILLGLEFAL